MCKIAQYIIKHNLINKNEIIVIGLSGGPDSMFLLHMLVALREKYNLTLIAAHLNHEWRAEADAEEKLCQVVATQRGIPFISTKISALTTTKKKYNGSKEEFARHMRRQFLEKVAHEHNAHRIALGHHAQDQQETFFIRLIRGTSLAGLVGMQPRSDLYIRPLLETNKADILAWLAENNIAYATDISNESPDYLRNRIRLNVLPALQHCDNRWNDNFLATIKRLARDNNFLDQLAANTLEKLTCDQKDNALDAALFTTTHPALQQRIIVQWLIQHKVPFPATQAFLDEIIRFICSPTGGTHAIHEQWSLIKKQGKVMIKR